jgi:hypothetical protein
MGRDLGELGVAKTRGDTFGWFGHTIRVGESFSDLRLIDFLEQAEGIDGSDTAGSMRALKGFLTSVVHPDDWATFWQACLDNGQGITDLMGLIKAITEATVTEKTGRPSKRRSDSSAGRRAIKGSSKGDSSSRVIRRLEKHGRPDLAVVVEMARDAQATG